MREAKQNAKNKAKGKSKRQAKNTKQKAKQKAKSKKESAPSVMFVHTHANACVSRICLHRHVRLKERYHSEAIE